MGGADIDTLLYAVRMPSERKYGRFRAAYHELLDQSFCSVMEAGGLGGQPHPPCFGGHAMNSSHELAQELGRCADELERDLKTATVVKRGRVARYWARVAGRAFRDAVESGLLRWPEFKTVIDTIQSLGTSAEYDYLFWLAVVQRRAVSLQTRSGKTERVVHGFLWKVDPKTYVSLRGDDIAGVDTDRMELVPGSKWPEAMRWLARQIAAADQSARSGGRSPAPSKFTVAALREMTGLANTALNHYAKDAGVTTPRRGEKNFQYPAADVRRILMTIIAQTSEKRLRAKCQHALRNLPEIV